MYKVKATLATALMLTALGGAGVCAYYLCAQEPAAKGENPAQPSDKKAAEKTPEKRDADDLQALMRERLAVAQDILKQLRKIPEANWHDVAAAAQRVLQSDLELSPNKAARIAAYERHVKVAEDLARFADKATQAGGLHQTDSQLSRYLLIDAKIGLEREKGR